MRNGVSANDKTDPFGRLGLNWVDSVPLTWEDALSRNQPPAIAAETGSSLGCDNPDGEIESHFDETIPIFQRLDSLS